MTNCFNSKYPIVALAMNQVSNAKFAVDCHNVGIDRKSTRLNSSH